MSHGFGSTKHPDSCIFLNFAVTEVCFAEVISRTYAALAHAREWNGKRCAWPTICLSPRRITSSLHQHLSKFAVTDRRSRKPDRYPALAQLRCCDRRSVVRPVIPEADPSCVLRDKLRQRQNRRWRRYSDVLFQPELLSRRQRSPRHSHRARRRVAESPCRNRCQALHATCCGNEERNRRRFATSWSSRSRQNVLQKWTPDPWHPL